MFFLPQSRRRTIRIYSYALLFCACLVGTICMQRTLHTAIVSAENRMRRAVLAHMSEENDALRQALASSDTSSVVQHADALCGYAAFLDVLGETEDQDSLISALSDTALFYAALSDAASGKTAVIADAAFWQGGTDTVSSHIAALALALQDRRDPAVPTDSELHATASLAAFSASFAKDPLRIPAEQQPGFRFAREPIVSAAEARQVLRTLIGNAASFLGNTVEDDAHGCYIFSCQNGYAEVSRCGGHLLSYAFYPRGNGNVRDVVLNDADLLSIAAAFLKKAGLPSSSLTAAEDRHGIRIFVQNTDNGGSITVGIRMHDGIVVQLQAESYYHSPDTAN